jgi:hypothetical protein
MGIDNYEFAPDTLTPGEYAAARGTTYVRRRRPKQDPFTGKFLPTGRRPKDPPRPRRPSRQPARIHINPDAPYADLVLEIDRAFAERKS